jgi:hypothetical protein
MQFFRGSFLFVFGLLNAISLAGFTPSFTVDPTKTNGQFSSSVTGDSGAGSYDALVNSDPASFNAFSGASFGGNSTATNGSTYFTYDAFGVNASYSFNGTGNGFSNFTVRGGITITELSGFAVNYVPNSGNGVSKFFINGVEINNPEGQTYSGLLNVGDKLEFLVSGSVSGPGTVSGNRGIYAEVCAVPEPASLAALGGSIALLARRRRTRKS